MRVEVEWGLDCLALRSWWYVLIAMNELHYQYQSTGSSVLWLLSLSK